MPDPDAKDPVKKKSNGCLIALGIATGLLLLAGLGAGLLVWSALTGEKAQKAWKLAGGAIAMAQQARTGPGTRQLRELGCSEAMVMDLASFRQLAEQAGGKVGEELQDAVIVACSVKPRAAAPTCEQVAETYRRAVPTPPGFFLVMVQREGGKEPECSSRFDASGAPLGPAAERQ